MTFFCFSFVVLVILREVKHMKDIIYVWYVFGNVTFQKCYQAVAYLHMQKSQINVIINLRV